MKTLPQLAILLIAATLNSCSSVYYGAMDQIGIPKRDILISRVTKARDAQEDTVEQFQSALEQFKSVVNFDGGNLEKTYNELNTEFERSEARAQAVHDRNDEVDNVARALFKEWKAELDQYSDASLRASSSRQLADTQRRFDELMRAMRRAEKSVDPVLNTFRDHVLFLKHNLNARAIGSLKGELRSVEVDTQSLIREMNASIAEADRFIKSMKSNP